MNERDPMLDALFEQTRRELVDDSFTDQVMARIEKRRRNVLLGRLSFVAALVVLELLLSSPLQNSVGMLTETLSTSLISLDNEWLSFAVAPLNSVAGLIGMLILGMQFLFRRRVR